MKLATKTEWSSHQPLIMAAMEYYKPKFVLELGTGDYSTPHFLKAGVKYLGIENDENWVKHIKEDLGDINIKHHDLGDNILAQTKLSDLSEEKKMEIIEYYENIKIPKVSPKLLFVDQFRSARTLSLNTLGNKFDIIIYHDCQPDGIKWYDYDLIDLPDYKTYYLKSDIAWTALKVKTKTLDKDFIQEIEYQGFQYLLVNRTMKKMDFEYV